MTHNDLDILEESIGKRLRRLRLERGFSQVNVAEYLGISFQQVQKYEKCLNRISPGKLFLLSELYGIHISKFFPDNDHYQEQFEDHISANYQELELLSLVQSLKSKKSKKQAIEFCKQLAKAE